MDSIKVMAFVAQFAPVSISKRYLDLGEEDKAQNFAKILWHVRRISQLIEATLASRLCNTVTFCGVAARRFSGSAGSGCSLRIPEF